MKYIKKCAKTAGLVALAAIGGYGIKYLQERLKDGKE